MIKRAILPVQALLMVAILACGCDSVYVVDSATDAPDAHAGDGQCVTTAGECTLRAAVMEGDAKGRAYRIELRGIRELQLEKTLSVAGTLHLSGPPSTRPVLSAANPLDGPLVLVLSGAEVLLEHLVLSGHNPSLGRHGGAVAIDNGGRASIRDVIFVDSQSKRGGAGVYNEGDLTLDHCVFLRNRAGSFGGGVLNAGRLEMADSVLFANRAGRSGGGLQSQGRDSELRVSRTAIVANEATKGGGTVLKHPAMFTDAAIAGNHASETGGLRGNRNSPVTLARTVMAGNRDQQGNRPDCALGVRPVSLGGNIEGVVGGSRVSGRHHRDGGKQGRRACLQDGVTDVVGTPNAPAGSFLHISGTTYPMPLTTNDPAVQRLHRIPAVVVQVIPNFPDVGLAAIHTMVALPEGYPTISPWQVSVTAPAGDAPLLVCRNHPPLTHAGPEDMCHPVSGDTVSLAVDAEDADHGIAMVRYYLLDARAVQPTSWWRRLLGQPETIMDGSATPVADALGDGHGYVVQTGFPDYWFAGSTGIRAIKPRLGAIIAQP